MIHHTPLGDFETVDEFLAEILRRKSPEERLELEKSKRQSVIKTLTAYLKSKHPQWSQRQIATEIIRRIPSEEEAEWREYTRTEDCKEISSLNE